MTLPPVGQTHDKPLFRQDVRYPGAHPASKPHHIGMPSSQSNNQSLHQSNGSNFGQNDSQTHIWSQLDAQRGSAHEVKQPHPSQAEHKPLSVPPRSNSAIQFGGAASFASHAPQKFQPMTTHTGQPSNPTPANRGMQVTQHANASRTKTREDGQLMSAGAKQEFKPVQPTLAQPPQALAPKKINPLPVKQEHGNVFTQHTTPQLHTKTPQAVPLTAAKANPEVQVRQPTLGSSIKRSTFQAGPMSKRSKKTDHSNGMVNNDFRLDGVFGDEADEAMGEDFLDDLEDIANMVEEPKKSRDKHLFKVPPEFASPEALMSKIDIKRIIHDNLEIAKAFEPEGDWETARNLFDRADTGAGDVMERTGRLHDCFSQLIERKDDVLMDKKALTEDYLTARHNISNQSKTLSRGIAVVTTKRKGSKGRERSASVLHK